MRRIVQACMLWLVVAAPALACSCMVPDGTRSDHVRRNYQQARFVYSAYVHSVRAGDEPMVPRMVKLRVLQVWKGDLAPGTWLEVESDPEHGLSGCGLAVEADTAILAYTRGPALASCTMTGPLDPATGDIPLLNRLAGR